MRRKKSPLFLDGIWGWDFNKRKKIFGRIDEYFGDNFGRDAPFPGQRIRFLKFAIFLVLFVLFARLFQLTIINGDKNRALAENNRVRIVTSEAPRGRILDANGQLLAYSKDQYFLENGQSRQEISSGQLTDLEKQGLAGENFTGSMGRITKTVTRVYPFGEETAHITGYTSLVQKEDLEKNVKLNLFDFVGRLGVEQAYDDVLRGVGAKKIVEVDASGNATSILGQSSGTNGSDVYLTIDGNLQKKAYEALVAQVQKTHTSAGSLIITDVNNGGVLALVSYPSFDPTDVGKSITDEMRPLFNRAIAGTYPPGSVFKISSALAGLESGKITKDTEIEDICQFEIGKTKISNWFYLTYGGKDELLKIDKAIARSNDIFFFKLGEQVGLSNLKMEALKLGFGQKTGIDLPGEADGLLPDEVWKKANLNEPWFLGDTMHMAIGQGFLLTTPLQINRMTDFVAGGKTVKPHLVSRIMPFNGHEIKVDSVVKALQIKEDYINLVRNGMGMACQKGGTGWPFFDASYKIGCKTGTAEKLQGDPHAWFTAFAPYDYPKIAITVMIENGGEGSSVAAPVAKEILDWYFNQNQNLKSSPNGRAGKTQN